MKDEAIPAETTVVQLIGVHQDAKARIWKEVHLFKERRMVHVYGIRQGHVWNASAESEGCCRCNVAFVLLRCNFDQTADVTKDGRDKIWSLGFFWACATFMLHEFYLFVNLFVSSGHMAISSIVSWNTPAIPACVCGSFSPRWMSDPHPGKCGNVMRQDTGNPASMGIDSACHRSLLRNFEANS